MSQTPYRCACTSCQQARVAESYAAASEFFTYHAAEGHEVEIVRLERAATPTPSR